MVKLSLAALPFVDAAILEVLPSKSSACWKKVGRNSGLILEQNPGAGLGKIEPYDRVLKDGFMKIKCVKDALYLHGDKFGGNKHEYRLGETANVSIVHYNDHVAKEDRQKMTPTVCFDFCRTIPDMGNFGIMNGRECYCAPYFKAMASDSSTCDSVCEGDTKQMCGGKSKSNIWEMHNCNDGAQVLAAAAVQGHAVQLALNDLIPRVLKAAQGKQDLAADLQKKFGQAGDPDAGKLMQSAKVSAGKLLHLAEAAEEEERELNNAILDALALSEFNLKAFDTADLARGADLLASMADFIPDKSAAKFTQFDVAKKGDDLVKELKDLTPNAKQTLDNLQDAFLLSEPMVNPSFNVRSGSCVADEDGCVSTYGAFSDGRYANSDRCEIEVVGGEAELKVESFDVEQSCLGCGVDTGSAPIDWLQSEYGCYDGLCFNDQCFCGRDKTKLPKVVSGIMRWYSDYICPRSGFKLCGGFKPKEEEDRGLQYYSAMYFVDKEYVDVPMTCTGTIVEEPIYFKHYHGCAAACDARNQDCVGFSYFPTGKNKPNMCFLFSSFTNGQYYTGCDGPKKSFLQVNTTTNVDKPIAEEPTHPICVAKLSKFVGTTLKPNEEGKCKQCFRELTKADRCWD